MKCFDFYESCNTTCKKTECRMWITNKSSQNCTIIAAKKGPMTLQEIGNIFGVTRMRICQIEKSV